MKTNILELRNSEGRFYASFLGEGVYDDSGEPERCFVFNVLGKGLVGLVNGEFVKLNDENIIRDRQLKRGRHSNSNNKHRAWMKRQGFVFCESSELPF